MRQSARLFPLILSGILALVYVTACWAAPDTVSEGVQVGEMAFSWGQLLVFVGLGIAWGDMKRGQADLAKELARMVESEEKQQAKIADFWADRWPKVEHALSRIEAVEKRLDKAGL